MEKTNDAHFVITPIGDDDNFEGKIPKKAIWLVVILVTLFFILLNSWNPQ